VDPEERMTEKTKERGILIYADTRIRARLVKRGWIQVQ
jgi:hypothetical protein